MGSSVDYNPKYQEASKITLLAHISVRQTMNFGMHVLGLYLLLLSLLNTSVTSAAKSPDDHAKAILEWVTSKEGGFFNDKLELRRFDVDDLQSPVGMFAKSDLEENDILLSVPREVLITAEDDTEEYGGIWCPTAFNLIREMRLGDQSKYAPYVNYLLSQRPGQLPSAWSAAGKSMLLKLLGQADTDDTNDLPPASATNWLDGDWKWECEGSDDPLAQNAAMLLVQRGWDDYLIPLFDMMSHRNGKWLNSYSESVFEYLDEPIVARASRDIKAGEQIYMSYQFCADCGNKVHGYGTPEIFRDYGFVEQYPQRWFFGRGMSFVLDEDDSGKVELEWLGERGPTERGIQFLFERLVELEEAELVTPDLPIPKEELDVIRLYHKSMMDSIKFALSDLDVPYNSTHCGSGDGSCTSVWVRYDSLGYVADQIEVRVEVGQIEGMNFAPLEELSAREAIGPEAHIAVAKALRAPLMRGLS